MNDALAVYATDDDMVVACCAGLSAASRHMNHLTMSISHNGAVSQGTCPHDSLLVNILSLHKYVIVRRDYLDFVRAIIYNNNDGLGPYSTEI